MTSAYLQERQHQKLYGKPVVEKKVYKIKHRSDKRIKQDKELKKIFIERFLIDTNCQLKSPVCSGVAECLDHLQKTSPNNRLQPQNLIMSCFRCNGFKETQQGQEWSKNTGNHISRFKK